MPVKTPSELKKFFTVKEKPSQVKWNHFFDSMNLIREKAEEAYAVNGPLIWVPNETARLAIGPFIYVGRMVKQQDTGRTYVKQVNPGSNPADWTDIGDTNIVIADVNGLTDELGYLLRKDVTNSTSGVLYAYNFYQTQAMETVIPIDLGGSELVTMPFGTGPALLFAECTKDFTLLLNTAGPEPWMGMPQTVVVRNSSVSAIQFTLPVGSSTEIWVLSNGSTPVIVPVNYHLTLAVQGFIVDVSDPAYTPGAFRWFVTYGLQAVDITT